MAAIDITTVSAVRTWMPAPASAPSAPVLAQQNAILQAAITGLSVDFLRRTGKMPGGQVPAKSPFNEPVSLSELYDGNGNSRMFVRVTPILSVQSLSACGVAIPQSTGPGIAGWSIDNSAKSISLAGGTPGFPYAPTFALGSLARFPRGVQNIEISYTAGFNSTAVDGELLTIPASPGPYTLTTNLPLLADGGVKYFSNGTAFSKVNIAPAAGQYYLNNGTYLFNAADAGQQVLIAYTGGGAPPDLSLAATKTIFLVYQRRGWEGLASLAKPESGQTSYTRWELDPDVVEVLDNYSRTAIV